MKLWLNVKEAAEYAGVCADTIYTACERRESAPHPHRRTSGHPDEAGVDRRVVRAVRLWRSRCSDSRRCRIGRLTDAEIGAIITAYVAANVGLHP